MTSYKKVIEIIDSAELLDEGFQDIAELSKSCKYTNCTHTTENDCAVKKAIMDGLLSEERFNSYYKEKNETAYVFKQTNKTKAVDYMKQRKLFKKS
ncbi:hypothetical protein VBD025_16710 [Virgibacillus flavescens]|uniref:hypothetical protein n=1 Tax=Virgibacillus flavescens TaxID=1611422 RepID=UPI003D32B7B4